MTLLHDIAPIDQTQQWAMRLSRLCECGDVVTLTGDLGTGKTTFVSLFCQALNIPDDQVSSPTFGLVHIYRHIPPLWHFDLYRLKHADELFELDLEDALAQGISLIEWPQIALPFLPASRLDLTFTTPHPGQRFLSLSPQGDWIQRLHDQRIPFNVCISVDDFSQGGSCPEVG